MSDSSTRQDTRSEFIAHLAHDVRGVLNGLQGVLSILDDVNRDAQCVEFIDAARNTSSRLGFILNNLLDMARIEAGRTVRQDIAFSPHDTVQSLVEYYAGLASQQGVRLQLQIDEQLPGQLLGDVRHLVRILENLLDNALRHAMASEVRVEVRQLARQQGSVRYAIRVMDNGTGLPETSRESIFLPYRNMHDSPGAGSRLGLPLAAALAELLGGRLDYRAGEQGGSCFTLELVNVAPVVPGSTRQAAPAVVSEAGPQKMLVVDDNELNRKVIQSLLGLYALSADGAASGGDALRLAQRHDYSLVFMDCRMPGMDGLEATRRLRAEEHLRQQPAVPVIALTGDVSEVTRQACIEAGMSGFLYKPVTAEALGQVLVEWLDNRYP